MKIVLVAVLLVAVVSAFTEQEYKDSFVEWMHKYEKIYAADEFQARFEAFKGNMDFVRNWNAGLNSHEVELNFLADLTNEEYQRIYLGTKFDAETMEFDFGDGLHVDSGAPLADTVDWRTSGAVTGVKNQGQCGSCWSFSTTGSVEGVHKIRAGSLVSLSEQNLMDCSTAQGNHACNGGLMNNAFKYIQSNHGIDTEASYPYTAKAGTCHFSAANVGATITGYKSIAQGSESGLMSAVNTQPVSVAIDASHSSFQLYKSGVYYEAACSSTRLDHGVLAVGYGSSGTSDYWIVKNSWGTTWGTQGYINMARNRSNNCGIATQASYPTA